MTRALVLNPTTGNLETSAILPHIALRPELHYKEISYPDANTLRVSYYTNSSKTTELYRITVTRTNGVITSRTDVDYTKNITRNTAYTRTNGLISSVEVT
jgi:hypothetical protein